MAQKNSIKTSPKISSRAGKQLNEEKSPVDKSIAGSALSNARKSTKRKKK
jgi:hypothetical protein